MNINVFLLIAASVGLSNADDDLVLQLWEKHGKIRGHTLKSFLGNDYYAFQEIPYATPPIGSNRFKEPKEAEDWEGIRNTSENTKVCMQNKAIAITPVPSKMNMTEDCLYLNVYTPVKPGSGEDVLPVLFWIHGGGFFYGSGAIEYYDPKYFMDHNIVVVTINYRLGPFGFLTTADEVIPGNIGLKDQALALRWVSNNIHLFRGDRRKVTVMGESAGSTSAGYLQLSKKVSGLASGFILESGSPLSPYAYQDDPKHFAFKMGAALDTNFKSKNSKDLLELLQSSPAENILYANVSNDRYSINIISRIVVWLPIIEDKNYANAFITEPMYTSLLRGHFNHVPLMTGYNAEESFFFVRGTSEQISAEGDLYDQNIALTMNPRLNVSPECGSAAGRAYRDVYTNSTFKESPGAFLKYLSDEVFATPNIRHAELASLFAPTYLYQFSFKGKMGGLENLPNVPGAGNVGHTEELKYLFGGIEGSSKDASFYPDSDQLTMRRMLTLWTNFIKYHNPTPEHDSLLNVRWPLVEIENIHYLDINRTLEVQTNPQYYNRVKRVFEQYSNAPFVVY